VSTYALAITVARTVTAVAHSVFFGIGAAVASSLVTRPKSSQARGFRLRDQPGDAGRYRAGMDGPSAHYSPAGELRRTSASLTAV
jgi:transketolase C-terminal domain/subunit